MIKVITTSILFAAASTCFAQTNRLQLTNAVAAYGMMKCETRTNIVLMSGLPATIPAHFQKLREAEAFIAREDLRIKQLNRAADRARANNQDGADALKQSAREQSEDLIPKRQALADLQEQSRSIGNIGGVKTGKHYAGLEVWSYAGPAPPEAKPKRR